VPAQWGIDPEILSNSQRLRPHRPAHTTRFHIHSFKDVEADYSSWRDPKPPKGLQKKGEEVEDDEDSTEDDMEFAGAPGPAPAPYPMAAKKKKAKPKPRITERSARRSYRDTRDDLYEARMRRLNTEADHGLAKSRYLHAKAGYTVARAEEDEDAMKEVKESIRRMKKVLEKAKKEHLKARAAHRRARLEHREATKDYEKFDPPELEEKEEKEEKEEVVEKEEEKEKKEEEKNPFEKGRPSRTLMWACPLGAVVLLIVVYYIS